MNNPKITYNKPTAIGIMWGIAILISICVDIFCAGRMFPVIVEREGFVSACFIIVMIMSIIGVGTPLCMMFGWYIITGLIFVPKLILSLIRLTTGFGIEIEWYDDFLDRVSEWPDPMNINCNGY